MAFVPTLDAAKAKAFYAETLGLEFVFDDGFALVFVVEGVLLRIQKVQEFTPHKFTSLGFEVEDIVARVNELMKKDVVFEIYEGFGQDALGIMTFPGGAKVAWFKDPDGNLLSLTEIGAG